MATHHDTRTFEGRGVYRVRARVHSPRPKWQKPPYPEEAYGCAYAVFLLGWSWTGLGLGILGHPELALIPGWLGIVGWSMLGFPWLVSMVMIFTMKFSLFHGVMGAVFRAFYFAGRVVMAALLYAVRWVSRVVRPSNSSEAARLIERRLARDVELHWEPKADRLRWEPTGEPELLDEQVLTSGSEEQQEIGEGTLRLSEPHQTCVSMTPAGEARLELWSPQTGERLVVALTTIKAPEDAPVIERPCVELKEEAECVALLYELLDVYGLDSSATTPTGRVMIFRD